MNTQQRISYLLQKYKELHFATQKQSTPHKELYETNDFIDRYFEGREEALS